MRFNVSSELAYQFRSPGTLILNIHALKTSSQQILEEFFLVEPYFFYEELLSLSADNRFVRINVTEPSPLKLRYKATVDNSYTLLDPSDLYEVPLRDMDALVLSYLNPSRYCQSDKLYRLANNMFGHIENAFEKVLALTEWIYNNVEYLSGSTNSQTSAYDTVTEQAGVCRDFAHLGIALCRALTIPARYFTGYSYKLSPPDFHACFEAYLGGRWIIFDPTRLAPLNGLVKIATGRDAADTAIASIFGDVQFDAISVTCESAEDNFVPHSYTQLNARPLSYL
ncbi:transglutaminase-like putative cysteine protease [Arcticibacter pallidicorallinus]|uniref:Transglutaminase-like putative cysteine protease n=1 Tax=Arcticibacter pallidicorallinus TaxID=1259464 RepID=A0A2T0U331_9SPHI|nr:transglutaminase family protein [Arcticibacter pallidicorallinus]PRY52258.1 transglutaminase-like putative cysteine protease [Arcticibacter pallidicorallinus]